MTELRHYLTRKGRDPFGEWLSGLRDLNAVARIEVRLARLERCLFGDCEPIGEGLSELRIHWGPGYRIYFGREGSALILLLCGGDKRTQAKDIQDAKNFWNDHKARAGQAPGGDRYGLTPRVPAGMARKKSKTRRSVS